MMPIVQITGQGVAYCKNNFLMSEFVDQEFYEVPPHVAAGMVRRGWAKLSPQLPPAAATQPRRPTDRELVKADDKQDDRPKRGGKS